VARPLKVIWKIKVIAAPELGEALSEALQNLLGLPVSVFEDLKKRRTEITVFLERKPDCKTLLTKLEPELIRLARLTAVRKPTLSLQRVPPQDWTESWKRHFKPIEIGSKLLLKPTWSKRKPRKNQALVVLEPGLSFGTGQHPTTSFCLEQLVHLRPLSHKSKSMLDLGCGSGILAIAAAKLGYSPIEPLDFDSDAVRIALQNATANHVANRIRVRRADVARLPLSPRLKFDLICANLISTVLLAHRDRIVAQLAPGGVVILAGILKAEFREISVAYAKSGLKLAQQRAENEWKSGTWIALELF